MEGYCISNSHKSKLNLSVRALNCSYFWEKYALHSVVKELKYDDLVQIIILYKDIKLYKLPPECTGCEGMMPKNAFCMLGKSPGIKTEQ